MRMFEGIHTRVMLVLVTLLLGVAGCQDAPPAVPVALDDLDHQQARPFEYGGGRVVRSDQCGSAFPAANEQWAREPGIWTEVPGELVECRRESIHCLEGDLLWLFSTGGLPLVVEYDVLIRELLYEAPLTIATALGVTDDYIGPQHDLGTSMHVVRPIPDNAGQGRDPRHIPFQFGVISQGCGSSVTFPRVTGEQAIRVFMGINNRGNPEPLLAYQVPHAPGPFFVTPQDITLPEVMIHNVFDARQFPNHVEVVGMRVYVAIPDNHRLVGYDLDEWEKVCTIDERGECVPDSDEQAGNDDENDDSDELPAGPAVR